MPRRGFIPKRDVLPDPVYNDKVVTRLINNIMLDGKKGTAQKIVYGAFEIIKEKTGKEPVEVFREAMDNDLNTSLGVTALYDVLKAKCNDATKLAVLADFDKVMSLNLIEAAQELAKKQAEEEAANADPEIDALVAARTAAKKAKDFAEADRIRDELKAMGVEIIDTPQGTKWRKV